MAPDDASFRFSADQVCIALVFGTFQFSGDGIMTSTVFAVALFSLVASSAGVDAFTIRLSGPAIPSSITGWGRATDIGGAPAAKMACAVEHQINNAGLNEIGQQFRNGDFFSCKAKAPRDIKGRKLTMHSNCNGHFTFAALRAT
jgi:hypothetical protein